MYQSAGDYYADLAIMRSEASILVGTVRRTLVQPAIYNYTVRRFAPDLVTLHFSMPNFYLQGVQVGTDLFRFRGSRFALVNCTSIDQNFKEDYASMGWQKNNDSIIVNLADVNAAFEAFIRGNPDKITFRTIVIAFAEGFRFTKIAQKVAEGTALAGKELELVRRRRYRRAGPVMR